MKRGGLSHLRNRQIHTSRMNAFYRCTKCGYVYDQQKEAVKFRTLSADWKCPECGAEKRDFIRLHRAKE